MKTKEWGLFWLVGLLWGTSFFWIKIALEEVSPVVLVAFRTLFGSIGLGLIILINKKAGIAWKTIKEKLPVFLVLGLINIALPFSLISWAEQFIDSGTAAILNGSMPLFTVFLSPIFLKDERISLPKMARLPENSMAKKLTFVSPLFQLRLVKRLSCAFYQNALDNSL